MNQKLKSTMGDIDTQKRYSQDNLFHSLLGLFNVETKVYNKNLDIFNHTK
jgi:lipid A ethanolaminephosphotransferase